MMKFEFSGDIKSNLVLFRHSESGNNIPALSYVVVFQRHSIVFGLRRNLAASDGNISVKSWRKISTNFQTI